MKQSAIIVMVLLILALAIGGFACGKADPIRISDAKLKEAIYDAVGKSMDDGDLIYKSDLEKLTSFTAAYKGIEEIEELEYCVELTELNLEGNEIEDISPLYSLTKLTVLNLRNNEIVDIQEIKEEETPSETDDSQEKSTDEIVIIPVFSDLDSLRTIDLSGNNISDLSPLAELSNLESLNISRNEIGNISPISNLSTNLSELYVAETGLTDISVLASFSNLTKLDLSRNHIKDVSCVSGITGLTELSLGESAIDDMSSLLKNLSALTKLNLGSTAITDISPLTRLNELTELDLGSNQVSDISTLSNLRDLTSLQLGWSEISDISALTELTGLTQLGLGSNQISDISPIENLTRLTQLDLGSNRISDITDPLFDLTKLTQLDLGSNDISDISAISRLPHLTTLDLGSNNVTSISSISHLIKLTELRLGQNRIDSISVVSNFTSLTMLDLGFNNITDISMLIENESFDEGDEINLGINPIDSEAVKEYRILLRKKKDDSKAVREESEDEDNNEPIFTPPTIISPTTLENPELGDMVCGTSSIVKGTFVWTDYAYDDRGTGDTSYPEWAGSGNSADIIQLQIGDEDNGVSLQVILETLTDPDVPIVGIGLGRNGIGKAPSLPAKTWPVDDSLGIESLIVIDSGHAELWNYTKGVWLKSESFDAIVDPESNTIGTIIPRPIFDPKDEFWQVFGVAGIRNSDDGSWMNGDEPIYDLAFVGEELPENWQYQIQADILAGKESVSKASIEVDFGTIGSKKNESASGDTPGFHTYLYRSNLTLDEGIRESNSGNRYLGSYQPYLVHIPESSSSSMIVALHDANSNHFLALDTLGEDAVVIAPLGRGESADYTGISEQDVLDAIDDAVKRLDIDENHIVISGEFDGAVGAMKLATYYPDRWSAVVLINGTNRNTDDNAKEILRENLIHVPVYIANTDSGPFAEELNLDAGTIDRLGYAYRNYGISPAGDSIDSAMSNCLYSEASSTNSKPANPGQIVYSINPVTSKVDTSTGLDISHNSAYWVSDIMSNNGQYATVSVTSKAIAERDYVPGKVTDEGNGTDICGNDITGNATSWSLTGTDLSNSGPLPASDVIDANFENVGAATFDLEKAGISAGVNSEINVSSDSKIIITINGLHRNAGILINGKVASTADENGQAIISLSKGTAELTINHATFKTTSLEITPADIRTWTVGEKDFTVSAEITNTGIIPGTHDTVLQLESAKLSGTDVSVNAGASETVNFIVTKKEPGTYNIAVCPFEIAAPTFSPELEEIRRGSALGINATITNTSSEPAERRIVLKLDGKELESQNLLLLQDESVDVYFNVDHEKSTAYTVEIATPNSEFKIGTNGHILNSVFTCIYIALLLLILIKVVPFPNFKRSS